MENAEYRPALPDDALTTAELIYDSAHELFDFMFSDRTCAEQVLRKLLGFPRGHFGFEFATVLVFESNIAGVALGYNKQELSAQELPGTVNTFRAAPLGKWLHIATTVNRALGNYVPEPSGDAYYINNIAVNSKYRGQGFGKQFLDYLSSKAINQGLKALELDVTEPNSRARAFYEKYGFEKVSESGSDDLEEKYKLPKLNRMRIALS